MGSVHAGRPDKGFAELHVPGVSGDIDEENNQAVDSDMDDPRSEFFLEPDKGTRFGAFRLSNGANYRSGLNEALKYPYL